MSSVERAALSAQREQGRGEIEKVVRCHGDGIHRASRRVERVGAT